jgi:hypothetical protein
MRHSVPSGNQIQPLLRLSVGRGMLFVVSIGTECARGRLVIVPEENTWLS